MFIKDYYKILQLLPSATLQEIKRSFRQLAQQNHPDKHNNDPYKAEQFSLIKEAYEILSNPRKKNIYLQQRCYNQSIGIKFSGNEAITPAGILKQCLDLNRYVATLDKYRMDKEGLTTHLCEILSLDTIEKLKMYKEPGIFNIIIVSILETMNPLITVQVEKVTIKLLLLACESEESKRLIAAFTNRIIK